MKKRRIIRILLSIGFSKRQARRTIGVLLCISFWTVGCAKQERLIFQDPKVKNSVHRSTSLATFSEHIRTVWRISQETTQVADNALKQVHDARPDLVSLSERIQEDIRDLGASHTLAAAYMEEGLYFYAFQVYQQLRVVASEDLVLEKALAHIWDKWGDYSLALQHAEHAIVLDPESAETLELLGRVHLHGKNFKAAIPAFLAALRMKPADAALFSNLSEAHRKLGHETLSRMYLEKSLELDGSINLAP
jgi:tetratricopeptide (TPR) repeat protein